MTKPDQTLMTSSLLSDYRAGCISYTTVAAAELNGMLDVVFSDTFTCDVAARFVQEQRAAASTPTQYDRELGRAMQVANLLPAAQVHVTCLHEINSAIISIRTCIHQSAIRSQISDTLPAQIIDYGRRVSTGLDQLRALCGVNAPPLDLPPNDEIVDTDYIEPRFLYEIGILVSRSRNTVSGQIRDGRLKVHPNYKPNDRKARLHGDELNSKLRTSRPARDEFVSQHAGRRPNRK